MRRTLPIALAVAVLGSAVCAFPQPRVCTIGLAVTDQRRQDGPTSVPGDQLDGLANVVAGEMKSLLAVMGRFRAADWAALPRGEGYEYRASEPPEYGVHVIVHQFGKIYRNRLIPRSGYAQMAGGGEFRAISQPAIAGKLEVRLVDPGTGDTFWSGLRDSTAIVPHDPDVFLFNPDKYSGWTPPPLIQAHLAGILRLQQSDPAVGSALLAADLWHVSTPADDAWVARNLLTNLVSVFYTDIDGNLPLEGRVAALLPGAGDRQLVRLDIGAGDGLVPRLRLDVWRGSPTSEKVGQIEVVQIDSTTAVARLRRLEKSFRQRGGGLLPDDRVVSRRRASARRRGPP